jgi:hypothetical protein
VRSTSDKTGTGLLQQAPTRSLRRSSCQASPARPTDHLKGNLTVPAATGVRPGGRTRSFNIPAATRLTGATSPAGIESTPTGRIVSERAAWLARGSHAVVHKGGSPRQWGDFSGARSASRQEMTDSRLTLRVREALSQPGKGSAHG